MSVNIGTIVIEGLRPRKIDGSAFYELEFKHENGQRFFIRVNGEAIDALAHETGDLVSTTRRYRLLIEAAT